MKLYVNKDKTKFVGNQIDAKKDFGIVEPCEVPTDKPGLIAFLNNYEGPPPAAVNQPAVMNEYPSSGVTNPPNDTLVGRCNMVELKELSTTLNVLINKTWNSMDQLNPKAEIK